VDLSSRDAGGLWACNTVAIRINNATLPLY
jgi:hypothetical protein